MCFWTPQTLKQFADLQQALVTAPILVFPNFQIAFHIQTDASQKAIGGVLLQKVDGSNPLHSLVENYQILNVDIQRRKESYWL
jgi:hypothetical protein